MATRRYADAFDDEMVESEPSHMMAAEFLSDDEEYCSSVEEEVPIEEPEFDHAKHLADLNLKYAKSLEGCHEVLKDKLNWAANFVSPTPSTIEFGSQSCSAQIQKGPRERRLKFGKAVPFAVNVKVGPSGIDVRRPVIDKLCKFIDMEQECPFGTECRFSHDVSLRRQRPEPPKNRMVTAEGKTKKIWMCKAVVSTGKCKYGQQCAYAHSADEVKRFVTDCFHGPYCQKVKRKGTEYENIGDRKCMRLHPRERIANFIARTS
jgi:hypothetical protein